MDRNSEFIFDKPLYPFRTGALLVILPVAFLFAEGIIENGLDGEAMLAFAVALALMLGAAWLASWGMRKYRVRVDAEGIFLSRPRKESAMRWRDVRTAAVVYLDGEQEIVLSTLEPQEALVYQRLMRRQDDENTVMHMGAGDRNRRLVEHHLHMTLPEIHLDKRRKGK